jgi:2-methylisocitrate lyase-like PEP mutase family enzyme
VAHAAGATHTETLELAAKLVRLRVPITVDIEAGFGADPRELAAQLCELGVAGVNLEDGRGDHLAEPAEQAELLGAFKDGAPGIFLNARIDTHWLGLDRSSTIERARRYADAGADGVFVPGLVDDREIIAMVAAVALPLNVLAQRDVRQLAGLGVRRVSTGSLLFRAALGSAVATAEAVRDGTPIQAAPTYETVQALASRGDPVIETVRVT